MKKLIKFEVIKACHNTLYLAITIVISLILMIHMLYSFNYYHPSYVTKQQNNAKTQLQTNKNLSDEIMLSYQRITGNISWQDIYQNYNEIDSYNQGMITDLDYDSQSNIDYRNYQLKYQINPDDNSGGNWLINLYNGFLKYVVIVIIIFSSLNIILVEFQEQTSNYLFSLGYSYKKIFLSKLIINFLIIIITTILPMIIFYLIYSLISGFTNPHTIYQTSSMFATIKINHLSFITVNQLLLLNLTKLLISCIGINVIIFLTIYFTKIKYFR